MDKNGNRFRNIIMLCRTMIGISILYLPYTIKNLGIFLGTFLIGLTTIINVFSLKFVADVGHRLECDSIIVIGEHAGGRIGKFIVALNQFSLCIIVLIFYFELTVSWVLVIGSKIINNGITECVPAVIIVILYVLSVLFPKANKLNHVNTVCILILGCFSILLLWKFFTIIGTITQGAWYSKPFKSESIESIGIILFAYCTHLDILSVTNRIHTEKERSFVIIIASIVTFVINSLTSIIGYLCDENVECDFLQNKSPVFLINIMRLALNVTNILTFLQVMASTREALDALAGNAIKRTNRHGWFFFETTVIVLFVYLMFMITSRFSYALITAFYIINSFVMFLIPSFSYWKVMVNRRSISTRIITTVNILMGIFCISMGVLLPLMAIRASKYDDRIL